MLNARLALIAALVAVSVALLCGAGPAAGRTLSGPSALRAAQSGAVAPEVDPGPDSSTAVTSNTDSMAAMYGVGYLTGGDTVLVGATDSAGDEGDSGAFDTDLQVAIVDGSTVNTVAVPLPAGASTSTAYIGGAAVTALTNGDFAVLYWGDDQSAQVDPGDPTINDSLPNYYVQVFTPSGDTAGSLITLDDNGAAGNPIGAIAEDTANNGFVVAANTDNQDDVVVQRYTNAGATSGNALSFSGQVSYEAVVDSAGDIVVPCYSSDTLFIPDGATSTASASMVSGPSIAQVTTDPSGGFVDFSFSGSDLDSQTISTSGALGAAVDLGNVGSIASSDTLWDAVTRSDGGYALTLDPGTSNDVTGYPATDQVISVSSLAADSTTVEDLTTSGGGAAPVGPLAVADDSGGIATYTDIPDTPDDDSPAGFPLNASVSAATYLDAAGPTLSASGTVTFTAAGGGVALDPTLGVTDPSSATLSSATVQIDGGFLAGDELSIDVGATGLSASYDAATGVLSISGTASLAAYEGVLRTVAYDFNSSDGDPTHGGVDTTRTIDWSVNDGTTSSSTEATNVDVQLQTQAALSVTSTSGTYGTALTLTTSGGSGTGTVSYTASDGTASGCTVSVSSLSVTSAGTCSVTATKAADDDYNEVASSATTVTFAKADQATLTLTSTSGTYGTPLTLTTSGGSGSGTVSYTASDGTATGCTVSSTSLTASSSGTCSVTATKGADGDYNQIASAATTVTLAGQTQAALTVTSTSGTYGTALMLTTSGGSGTGTVSYTASDGTASGCTLSGSSLSVTSAGTCSVTATKAADSTYAQISSDPTTVTFAKADQAALSVTSTSGTYGTALTLTTSGGSGTGTLSYTASDGTASGCTLSGSSLSASSAGTCSATATKAADGNYNEVVSNATTVTFAKADQAALSVTSTSGTAGTALTLTTTGGSGTGTVSYTVTDGTASGCAVSGSSLSVTSAGTCSVTATKAADGDYNEMASNATTVTFAAAAQTSTPGTTSTTSTTSTSTTPTSTNPTSTTPTHRHHRKPKPKPKPKQHVSVRINGLASRATYFGAVPVPRCVAKTNVGHVSCRITQHVTKTKSGTTVTYTALARGSEGATATARITVHTAKLELGGLHASNGIYVLKLGNDYTLRVASRTKPLYIDAAPAPQPPSGTHDWFQRSGTAHGIPVWTLRVYLPAGLSAFPAWNLGIRLGNQTRIITIRT